MNRLVADSRARCRKAVQERLAAFFRRADEEVAFCVFEVFGKPGLRFINAVAGHFQQQVMFVFIAPGFHAFRQMRREGVPQFLHKAVGKVWLEQRHFLQHGVGTALQGEEERHFVSAEFIDHQEGVFAVLLGNIVDIAVHVLARHRQVFEFGQDMATNLGQHVRLVGADVKHLLAFFRREGVETHRKHRQLARAAGRFKQTFRVGVVSRWGIGIHVAHAVHVVVVMGVATVVLHITVFDALVIELAEDLLRRFAKVNAQMVDQRQLALFINARKQRHFGIGRAALHQRTAGVIADTANHRGADTGRTNHRVWLATERLQRFFQ